MGRNFEIDPLTEEEMEEYDQILLGGLKHTSEGEHEVTVQFSFRTTMDRSEVRTMIQEIMGKNLKFGDPNGDWDEQQLYRQCVNSLKVFT